MHLQWIEMLPTNFSGSDIDKLARLQISEPQFFLSTKLGGSRHLAEATAISTLQLYRASDFEMLMRTAGQKWSFVQRIKFRTCHGVELAPTTHRHRN
jgi:hypothetical protein